MRVRESVMRVHISTFFSDSFPIFSFSSVSIFGCARSSSLRPRKLSLVAVGEWEVLLLDGFSLRSMTSRAPGFWWLWPPG